MAKRNYVLRFTDGSRDPRKVSLEADTLEIEGLPEFGASDTGKHLVVNQAGDDVEWAAPFALPALPEDAATKTYALQAVNGVLTWVEVEA